MKTITRIARNGSAARAQKQAARNSAPSPVKTHEGIVKGVQPGLGYGFINVSPYLAAALNLGADATLIFNLGRDPDSGPQAVRAGDKVSFTLEMTTREPITKAGNVTVLESAPVTAGASTPTAKGSDSVEDAGMMFLRMELDVSRVLAVLDLLAKPLALRLNPDNEPEREATGLGFLELANDCATALFKDWQEACDEGRELRDKGVRRGMVNGRWPATWRLDLSVSEAAMLMARLGEELEDECLRDECRMAEREGREPQDRFGYLTMARRCGEALYQSFNLAWNAWDKLEKQVEQRQAA